MEQICIVEFEEVITEWAKRENCSKEQIWLKRDPVLSRLPFDTTWSKIKITKEDLPSLKLINGDIGWLDLSVHTGDIEIASRNVDIFSKMPNKLPQGMLPNGKTRQEYFDELVVSLHKFRRLAGRRTQNLTLVLISTGFNNSYTILEGNHTAVGLYLRHFIDTPQAQYPDQIAYLGISKDMINNRFYHRS